MAMHPICHSRRCARAGEVEDSMAMGCVSRFRLHDQAEAVEDSKVPRCVSDSRLYDPGEEVEDSMALVLQCPPEPVRPQEAVVADSTARHKPLKSLTQQVRRRISS